MYREVNFDGIVGPTHSFAGLACGNRASMQHRAQRSNPRAAALQGLRKMKFIAELGVPQAVLPPLYRPRTDVLRKVGFSGPELRVLEQAAREAPEVLAAVFSASSMWTANAATVAPSCDTGDGKAHFTPANLISHLHRSLEADETAIVLKAIFGDPSLFVHHAPLPATATFSDEGAANHTRLTPNYGTPGIHLFVYGRKHFGVDSGNDSPTRFPQRQTLEACAAIARLHRLETQHCLMLQQHPKAIDAGVFHNDVISTGTRNFFIYHHEAFVGETTAIDRLRAVFQKRSRADLLVRRVTEFTLEEAVQSYFFNSQIVDKPGSGMLFIGPEEIRLFPKVREVVDSLLSDTENPVREAHFLNLTESMHNGGGPACLRNRVVLSDEEIAAINARILLDDSLYQELTGWVNRCYRESLVFDDLVDPQLLDEVKTALDELTRILKIGPIYSFQQPNE
jgi:succinylarginine dihydrolase